MYGFITSTNTLLFAAVGIWCSAQILWKLFIPRFDSYVIFLNLCIFSKIWNQGCTVPICSLWFNWENISAQKSCSSFKIMSEVYTITFSWQFFKKKSDLKICILITILKRNILRCLVALVLVSWFNCLIMKPIVLNVLNVNLFMSTYIK